LGEWALVELKEQTANNPNVKEVRGMGLMIAIETKGPASIYLKEMLHKGVIAVTAGKKNIRLLPPLIISKDDLQQGIDIILEVLQ
jgi:acetylornithine/succinyldiaminopimelate/putrescine aminotransferase